MAIICKVPMSSQTFLTDLGRMPTDNSCKIIKIVLGHCSQLALSVSMQQRSANCWVILTGEYPPKIGGVAEYTASIARELALVGDEVHVWTPSPCRQEELFSVHALPDFYGPASLWILDRALNRLPKSHRLFVQYVPHSFGFKALNVLFCLWILSRRTRSHVWLMFHEVASSQGIRRFVNPFMARCLVLAAERILITVPAWQNALTKHTGLKKEATCLPVPSNLPTAIDAQDVARARQSMAPGPESVIFGYFGTCPPDLRESLKPVVIALLERLSHSIVVLIGTGSTDLANQLRDMYPEWKHRIISPGPLVGYEAAVHLSTCDVLLYPFSDGVSGRRTSLIAALALGLPIVTTQGWATEPFWQSSEAVVLVESLQTEALVAAALALATDPNRRQILSARARPLYNSRFSIEHTIAGLG